MKTGIIIITLLLSFSVKAETVVSYSGYLTLIKNCLYESNLESHEGKVEVTRVVLTRKLDNRRWPNTVNEVIYQKKQFSWTVEPDKQFTSKNINACQKAVNEAIIKGASNYTHYFAHKLVTPPWAKNYKKKEVIGNHTFLKL